MKTHLQPQTPWPDFAALIGLDWADQKHDLALRVPGANSVERRTLEHTPEAIAIWVAGLRQRFGAGKIALCLEQTRGALIYALSAYENLVLFPINPPKPGQTARRPLPQRQ